MNNEHLGGVECRSPLHTPTMNRLRRCFCSVASLASLRGLRPLLGAPAPVATVSGCVSLSRRRGGLGLRPCAPVLRSFAPRSSVAGGRSRYARGRKAASLRSPFARSPVAPLPASPPPSVRSGSPSLRSAVADASASPARGRPPSRRAPRSRPRRGLACPSASPRRAPSARGAVAPLCRGFAPAGAPVGRSSRPRGAQRGGARSRFAPPRAAPALFSAAFPLRSAPAAPPRLGLLALGCRSRAPSPASRAPRPSGVWGAWFCPGFGTGGVFRVCGRGLPPASRPTADADPRARG